MTSSRYRREGRSRNLLSHDDLLYLSYDKDKLEARVNVIVKSSIDSHLKMYKYVVIAFLAGLLLLVTSIATNGELFESIIKSIYKPENIYRDIEPNIPSGVWNAVISGSEEDYKNFVSKDEFYKALSEYHTNLVRTFLIPNREPTIRAREIMRVGGVPEDVRILMGGPQIEGQQTSRCFREFKNAANYAILVIPRSFEKSDYSWFDCAFGWPKLTIAINYQGREIDGIELVGVRRNGGTQELQVIVSKKVAKDLELPNWEIYKANAIGKIRVSKVN